MSNICLLCGNRDKSVFYYRFPKNKKCRKKWLAFCNIDNDILNTVTKLCSCHFEKDNIIYKAKGTVLKPDAVPTIKERKLLPHLDLTKQTDCSLERLKDSHNRTVNDKCTDNVDVNNSNSDSRTVESFEFVSVDDIYMDDVNDDNFGVKIETDDGIDKIFHNETDINSDNIDNSNFNNITMDKAFESTSVNDIYMDNIDIDDFSIKTEINDRPDKTFHDTDIHFDNVNVDNSNFDNRTVNKKNLESVSVDENPIALSIEPCATVNQPFTLSCENIRHFQVPVKNVYDHRYVKEIRTSHLDIPKKAQLAKRIITNRQRKIKTLQQVRKRLIACVTMMKRFIKHLKK